MSNTKGFENQSRQDVEDALFDITRTGVDDVAKRNKVTGGEAQRLYETWRREQDDAHTVPDWWDAGKGVRNCWERVWQEAKERCAARISAILIEG